jgi:hypothetical protein
VFAKHSKNFSRVDSISIGVDRMQRGFESLVQHIEGWRQTAVSDADAKLLIYRAFVEGELEAPRHLARPAHEEYFIPSHEEFAPRTLWRSITEISYGQDVHRRIGTAVAVGVFTLGVGALIALSKSKKHFVGITWANGDQKGGLAMQCDKTQYRGILNGLEGVSGKKAVDSALMTVKN